MIFRLQQHLNDIYKVGSGYDVRNYLITDRLLAKYIGRDAMLSNTSETLLVSQDEQGLAVSLFLDSDMLERLESSDPLQQLCTEQLDDLWKVMEGISHFNCMVWKASQDRPVTLLELELQAEIDKFVGTMRLALSQGSRDLPARLHGLLFDDVRFSDELDDEQADRYRIANEYAARFCRRLRHFLIDDHRRAISELRRFYRLQLCDKISHIHTQAWSSY